MNLYKLTQTVNNNYDTYDSFIAAAETEEEVKVMIPYTGDFPDIYDTVNDWALPEHVEVELIGKAEEHIQKGVILASFRAG